MDATSDTIRAARTKFEAVIQRVCGACENSCCHQGTMMGSQDLRRLYKGLLLEPGRRETVRSGLERRGEELQADLDAVRHVAELLRTSLPPERQSELLGLEQAMGAWQDFCDELTHAPDDSLERFATLLCFSAVRSNCLKALRQFEGAQAALANLSRGTASFRMTGRRIAAPRCLFHFNGCLAGPWKPAKCANFFCAGTPNVLREIAREISFDQFVMANFAPISADDLLRAIALELELGRDFREPKIVIGLAPEMVDRMVGLLWTAREQLRLEESPGSFMWSTGEARTLLSGLGQEEALVARYDSTGGAALYELAVALDGLRALGQPPAFYLFLNRLTVSSPLAHPLWADEMMSQPLGSLDLYVVE